MQVLGEDWRKTALDFQEKVHKVAVTILKALFIALGRDEHIINDVRLPLWTFPSVLYDISWHDRFVLAFRGIVLRCTCCMLSCG